MCLQAWPVILHVLFRKHGAVKLWQAGLQALDYPPNWVTDDDLEAVEKINCVLCKF